MAELAFVESQIQGFFGPGFVAEERVPLSITEGADGMLDPDAIPPTRVYDARQLQADARQEATFNEAEFFEEHGFVLLSHESAVANWDVEVGAPGSAGENELTRVYGPEVEELIRTRLLPRRRIDVWQGEPQRRGPGTPNPDYAGGVHQDFGLTPDDYQEAIEVFTGPAIAGVWRSRFEQDDVAGFVSIDFWRTAGMRGPLQHMPLAFCHPDSVRVEDVVPVGLIDFSPSGRLTNQSGLRHDPGQRWYYYPGMTPNEVLAFKQFQFLKDDPEPRVASCFHTAFELPDPPADAEPRQSSEHRVLVFLLRE